MEEIVLQAKRRQIIGKQVSGLRRAGQLPAVLYGRHVDAQPIALDLKETSRLIERLSPSALIVIQLDGDRHYALVREKQRNHLLGTLRHVDFQAVSLTEKVRANVSIHLTGEAPAVENFFGILVSNVEALDVEALPRDLPEGIYVDVAILEKIGDAVYVRDLVLPPGVEVFSDPDEIVVVVTAQASEEVTPEEEAVVEGTEPEVIEKGKREEEEEE
jgi:large subunit ribosomal protein L25